MKNKIILSHNLNKLLFFCWVFIIAAILTGFLLRIWYIFRLPSNADNAIVGLMANDFLSGHIKAFYWGQNYGGSGEPFVVAIFFSIFGSSSIVLKIVPAVLGLISTILVWRIALILVKDKLLAIMAACLMWASPQFWLMQSTLEGGFRGFTMLFGLVAILFALKITKKNKIIYYLILGLSTGLAWWSSPESLFLLLPAYLILLSSTVRDIKKISTQNLLKNYAALAVSILIGCLPWLWSNLRNGFKSLDVSTFAVPAGAPKFGGRLHEFFIYSLPMLFSLKSNNNGAWIFSHTFSHILFLVIIISLIILFYACIQAKDISITIITALATFPLILACSPATWFWEDGRYIVYVLPLFAIFIACGIDRLSYIFKKKYTAKKLDKDINIKISRLFFISLGTLLISISSFNFLKNIQNNNQYINRWGNPDISTHISSDDLIKQGVKYGYAPYWVAYKLDFISNGQLIITSSDFIRSKDINNRVNNAPVKAWLFPNNTKESLNQFELDPITIEKSRLKLINEFENSNTKFKIIYTPIITAIVPIR